jgi:hypothetical protein
MAGSSIKKF